jgi:hypothetical protein
MDFWLFFNRLVAKNPAGQYCPYRGLRISSEHEDTTGETVLPPGGDGLIFSGYESSTPVSEISPGRLDKARNHGNFIC